MWIASRCWRTRHDDPPLYSFRWVREWNIRRRTRRLKAEAIPRAPPPSMESLDLEEGRAAADDGARVVRVADGPSNMNALSSRTEAGVTEVTKQCS